MTHPIDVDASNLLINQNKSSDFEKSEIEESMNLPLPPNKRYRNDFNHTSSMSVEQAISLPTGKEILDKNNISAKIGCNILNDADLPLDSAHSLPQNSSKSKGSNSTWLRPAGQRRPRIGNDYQVSI